MQKCLNCSHEQEAGKFCAKCGSPIQSQENTEANRIGSQDENSQVAATEIYTQPKQSNEPNPNVEQVKQTVQNYMSSFVSLVKNPALATTNNPVNGTISFVLLSILLGLAAIKLVNNMFASMLGVLGGFIGYADENVLSAIYIFLFAFVFGVLSIVTVLTVFLANKLFVQERSFKSVFVSITNFYPLVIIIVLLTYLVALLNLSKFSFILFVIALTIVLTLAPLFVINRDMENKSTKIDKFFIFILVSLVITLISYFVTDVALSNILESFTPDFDDFW